MVERGRPPKREDDPERPRVHELDQDTNALADQELNALLEESGSADEAVTAALNSAELDRLLALSSQVEKRPPSPTMPYDDGSENLLIEQSAVDIVGIAPAEAEPPAKSPPRPSKPSVPRTAIPAPTPKPAAAPPPPAPAPAAVPAAAPAPAAVPVPAAAAAVVPAAAPVPAAAAPAPASVPVPVVAPVPVAALVPAPAPAPRAEVPSVPWPDPTARRKRSRIAIVVVLALGALVGLYLAFGDSTPEPSAIPSAPAPEPPPPPSPRPPAPPPPSQAEIDARAALDHLRDGLRECVIHGNTPLPGSSPAVPATLKLAAAPGYASVAADWRTAVWACARFKQTAPMRFQIQWQLVKIGVEGTGIAWIDEDGDGKAERAFSFRATSKGKGDLDVGEVAPLAQPPPVQPIY